MVETIARPVEIGEILTQSQEMVGAQGRILWKYQSALNKEYHVPDVLRDPSNQFASFDDRNYNVFETTLHKRREEYWNNREEKSLDDRYTTWEQELINWSHNDTESRWVREAMDTFFTSIGVENVRDNGFDKDKLAIIYDRYFRLPKDEYGNEIPLENLKGEKGIDKRGYKLFIDDAIKLVTLPDGKIDRDRWHSVASAMDKFSEVFGEPPGDFKKNVTMNLLEAELKLKDNPKEFVDLQTINKRLNVKNLTEDEEKLLDEICVKGGPPKVLPFDKESSQVTIVNKIDTYPRTFIEGGTGTGKTTRIAPMVYERLMKSDDKFLCSEPYKLNASTTAEQIAKILGFKIGEEVGWMHGDDKTQHDGSKNSKEKILVLTEGTAIHMVRDMNEEALNTIVGNHTGRLFFMVDEIHKLTKPGVELTYALMKLQEKFPERIKLIFATATAEKAKLQKKLDIVDGASHSELGTAFTVNEHFATPGSTTSEKLLQMKSEERNEKIADDVSAKLKEIFSTNKAKNVMVALPGLGEITAIDKRIRAMKDDPAYKDNNYIQNLKVTWIYGDSTEEDRIAVTKGSEKVPPYNLYLCTPAAETGVTFSNLTHGIGTGLVRLNFFNDKLGMNELKLVESSKAVMTQVRGRLGRTEEGEFYYLYTTLEEYQKLKDFEDPESVRAELVDSVMDFYAMGVKDISKITALTDFPEEQVKHAKIVLKRIGAMNENEDLTPEGVDMLNVSIDYRLARAIVESKKKHNQEKVITMAAIMEQAPKGLFVKLNNKDTDQRERLIDAKRQDLKNKVLHGDSNLGIPGVNTSDDLVLLKLWREYEEKVLTPVLTPIVGREIVYDYDKDLNEEQKTKLEKAKDRFCSEYGLSKSAMNSIEQKKMKLIGRILNIPHVNRGVWSDDVRQRADVMKCMSIGFEDRRFRRINNMEFEMVHNPLSDDDSVPWDRPRARISTLNNPFDPIVQPTTPTVNEIITSNVNITKDKKGNEVNYLSYNQQYMAA